MASTPLPGAKATGFNPWMNAPGTFLLRRIPPDEDEEKVPRTLVRGAPPGSGSDLSDPLPLPALENPPCLSFATALRTAYPPTQHLAISHLDVSDRRVRLNWAEWLHPALSYLGIKECRVPRLRRGRSRCVPSGTSTPFRGRKPRVLTRG